ncbi:MAG: type II toxin-antitoxin system VapB family antitoxin [Ardenticatenaceae bacterium]|nr:type II toxin-antitoxin system VapB family antitoxin [Ardenticatenaceae bacterium]
MATNLNIDPELLEEALKIGGLRTKRETVNQALDEFIKRRKRQQLLLLEKKIEYHTDYDYKEARRKR